MSPNNYRPFSHLVEIGLMVENAVASQVTEHFLTNKLFHPNHHRGIKYNNTTTALIQIQDLLLSAAEVPEVVRDGLQEDGR